MLELTETVLVADDDRAWSSLAELREDGVRIAIDDYGTGYASLSYLRQPIIDIVKVDRTFLADETSERDLRLLRGVNTLCADLGMEVIAEGVHDEASRAALVSVGYRFGQGFLYARALPLEAASRWTPQAPLRRNRYSLR